MDQIDRARRRQQMPTADMVVQEQPQPEQPGRSQAGVVRQNETQRANDMGRDLPEDFALDQRLAHQPKLVIFEIAQPAMHQLGRPGRRSTRQVIHFAQENGITPARRIARDAAAVDAASDDGEIEYPVQRNASPAIASSLRRFYFRIGVNHKEKRKQDERGQCLRTGRPDSEK